VISYRSLAIIKREIHQQIFTKKFLIMTLALPVFITIVAGLQVFITTFDREERATLHILNESAQLQQLLQEQLPDSELADDELYELDFRLLAASDLVAHIDAQRIALANGSLTGIVWIPDTARDDKRLTYYSANPANQVLQGRLRDLVNRTVVGDYFDALGIERSAIDFARTNVTVDGVRVSLEGNSELKIGNLVVAFALTLMIYMSLLTMGPAVMAAVNEEKTNRIIEVLLSAVTPRELLYGKIVGTAVAGLVQMVIWISPLVLLSLVSLPALVMMDLPSVNLGFFTILYFLVNYLMGIVAFLAIFAAFGAMFDTPQDAQGSMMPVMMLIIVPFFLAFSMARNPANALAEVSSMLPFATILVMPARMTLIEVPLWQVGVAFLVNLLTIWCCIRAGAKIYRLTILMTGKRPAWADIWRWLRHDG
jgi:ABC-2 type transport system permease protein